MEKMSYRPSRTSTPRVLAIATAAMALASATLAQCSGWTSGTSNLYTTCGLVGVGTSSPGFNLHVYSATNAMLGVRGAGNGTLDSGSIRFGNNVGDDQALIFLAGSAYVGQGGGQSLNLFLRAAYPMTFSTNAAERMRIDGGGNIGIGTTTPGAEVSAAGYSRILDVASSMQSAINILGSAAGTDAMIGDLSFSNNAIGGTDMRIGVLRYTRKGADNSGQFDLYTRSAGSFKNALSIAPNGDATFLGKVTGTNIQAQYQDVAEWVPVKKRLEPGTVVVIAPRQNEVMPSMGSYDTKVAGVVSAEPGVLLGQAGLDKAAIATTGRVRVRVDASYASIRTGDLLVTSDREGYAMRSQPIDVGGVSLHRPGTVLGKALEPLETGTGEILVLLTLQ